MKDLGGKVEPGKLGQIHPQDDLTLRQLAQSQAIREKDWGKFAQIYRKLLKESELSDADLHFGREESDDMSEEEMNRHIEDVWEDFKANVIE